MKTNIKLLAIGIIMLFSIKVHSQVPNRSMESLTKSADFNTIFSQNQTYYNTTGLDTVKGSGFKQFKVWSDFWSTRVGEKNNTGSFEPAMAALAGIFSSNLCNGSGVYNESWSFIGHEFTESSQSPSRGKGITERVYVDTKHDPSGNIIYLGTLRGGLWKTTNGTSSNPTWTCITDAAKLPGLGVNDLVIDPNDANIIYISTGIGNYYDIQYGMGILKTTDGGTTWTSTGLTYNLNNPRDIIATHGIFMKPDNPDILFAFKKNEIWKSTDAGVTFRLKETLPGGLRLFQDMVFLKNSPNTIFVSSNDRNKDDGGAAVFKSTDNGETWTDVTGDLKLPKGKEMQRIDLATTPANPNVLYASCADGLNNSDPYISKSTNEGTSWTTYNPPMLSDTGYWYNNLVISPTDENTLYIGGLDVYKYTNNVVQSLKRITKGDGPGLNSNWIHNDTRDMAIRTDPLTGNDIIYSANDGGLSVSYDEGITWSDLSGTELNITEIYGFDISLSGDWIVTGCQDLGIYQYRNNQWDNAFEIVGSTPLGGTQYKHYGDGFNVIMNKFAEPNEVFVQFNNAKGIRSSSDNGKTYLRNTTGGGKNQREFAIDVNQNVYVGYENSLFRKNKSSNSFRAIGLPFSGAQARISGIAISKSNPDVIYVGFDKPQFVSNRREKRLYKTTNGQSANPTWKDITKDKSNLKLPGLDVDWGGISEVVVDPDNADHVWVCIGHIYKTDKLTQTGTIKRIMFSSDGGSTWNEINKGLEIAPGVDMVFPVNKMILDEATGGMYIGTDIGVYYNPSPKDKDSSWICFNKEMPVAIVTDLKIDYCNRKILASTLGRGLWESDLAEASDVKMKLSTLEQLTVDDVSIFYSDIVIPSGTTMNVTGTLKMATGRSITVEPGAKLVIDGGKITSTCGQAWRGIIVEGDAKKPQNYANQGVVLLSNGGIIENANDAIYLIAINGNGSHDWGKTGGIVQATNSTFRNNRRDVAFLSFHNLAPGGWEVGNASYFTNCQFLTNNDNIIPDNEVQVHISMRDVNGVRIKGCTFRDDRTSINTDVDGRGGLFTIQSTYNGTKSEFHNMKVAIESYSNGSNGAISIENCDFNSDKGIYMWGVDEARIRANEFTIEHEFVLPHGTNYPYGVYLDKCQLFDLEGNKFIGIPGSTNTINSAAAGLVIRNTGANTNLFYRCEFNDLKIASEAIQHNKSRNKYQRGLTFRCNDYQNNWEDLFVTDDLYYPSSTPNQIGIATFQGYGSTNTKLTLDNLFGNSSPILNYNIENNGNSFIYFHDDPALNPREKPDVVTIPAVRRYNAMTNNTNCPDRIRGGIDPTDDIIFGIYSERLLMMQVLTNWKDIVDNGNTDALKQSVINATTTNVNTVYNGLLTMSPWLSMDVLAAVAEADSPFTNSMIRDVLVANPHSSRSRWIHHILEARTNPLLSSYRNEIDAMSIEFTERDEMNEELAYHSQNHDLKLNEVIRRYTSDALDRLEELDPLMKHPANPTYHYRLAEMYFDKGDLQSYDNVRNNIPISIDLNTEELAYNSAWNVFYEQLRKWDQSGYEIFEENSEIKDWLLNYVSSNERVPPRAYTLLLVNDISLIDQNVYIPDALSEGQPLEFEEEVLEELMNQNDEGMVVVYPNPAKKFVTFELRGGNESGFPIEITIVDNMGSRVISRTWKADERYMHIDLSQLSSGLYHCSFAKSGKVFENKKLLITN